MGLHDGHLAVVLLRKNLTTPFRHICEDYFRTGIGNGHRDRKDRLQQNDAGSLDRLSRRGLAHAPERRGVRTTFGGHNRDRHARYRKSPSGALAERQFYPLPQSRCAVSAYSHVRANDRDRQARQRMDAKSQAHNALANAVPILQVHRPSDGFPEGYGRSAAGYFDAMISSQGADGGIKVDLTDAAELDVDSVFA